MSIRFTPCVLLPPSVQVPVQIMFPARETESVLFAAPARVIFANVVPPEAGVIVRPPFPVKTRLSPFQFVTLVETKFPLVVVMVAVFAVIVRVPLAQFTASPAIVSVIALAPIVSVRVFEFDDENDPHEHVCPFVFNVPAVNVIAPVSVVPALCIRVRSDLLMVMDVADRATSMVTVAAVPELESKVTVSPATGTVWPPAPPVVADQWAVSLVLPVPSTQNLLAMSAYS